MTEVASGMLDAGARRRHKLGNLAQSALLLGGMIALLGLCVGLLLGPEGALWALAGAGLGLAFSPRVPPELVLRLYRARPVAPAEFPAGFEALDALARRAGLAARPRLYYVPSAVLNAFAVGRRDDAAIAVTDGLLRTLDLRELAGVLAHETSHIRNNDLWVMMLADVVSRMTGVLSLVGVALVALAVPMALAGAGAAPLAAGLLLVLAPTAGSLLQLALSRAREYDADLDAAGLTGDPVGLARALEKMERTQGRTWPELLMPGPRAPEPSLLRSHPPTRERIRRLLELVPAERARPFRAAEPFALPPLGGRVVRRPRWHLTGVWY